MGKASGFMEWGRETPSTIAPGDRIDNYKEFYKEFPEQKTNEQAARCMDCGIPFCHNACPLGNIIPEFNDAVYAENWKEAYTILSRTNNFPEFTGRICPAPCEEACVLGINSDPVTIEHIEKSIIERAYANNWVKPMTNIKPTGKRVAVVGSGPAGLAAAAQLRKTGHEVKVFERDDRIGGLLRYGIPDFKLDKTVVDRRLSIMRQEGIVFETGVNVGEDICISTLQSEYDAVILCGGSTVPRDLELPKRELGQIHFAMDYLKLSNKKVAGDQIDDKDFISAHNKNVVVIGGGDTGSDCIGTANRQGAKSIIQLEITPQPPAQRAESTPWPEYSRKLRTSSSHEEGCERMWNILTKEFVQGEDGKLSGIKIADLEWKQDKSGMYNFQEVKESERIIPCDIVFIATGFVHPQHKGMVDDLKLELDDRGNVMGKGFRTNVEGVFTAGDMRRGQSLVVWALMEGRQAAKAVDLYLRGATYLEDIDHSRLSV